MLTWLTKIFSGMQRSWWLLKGIANPVSRMTAAYNPLFTAPFCQQCPQTLSVLKCNFTAPLANLYQSSHCPAPVPSPHPHHSYQDFLTPAFCMHWFWRDHPRCCYETWSSQEQMSFVEINSLRRLWVWSEEHHCKGWGWEHGSGSSDQRHTSFHKTASSDTPVFIFAFHVVCSKQWYVCARMQTTVATSVF